MPVVQGDLYHFRAQDSSFITHTIRVDSVEKVGTDSIFYLNRIVHVDILNVDLISVANNKGQFMGQTMTKKPDGSLIFFSELYDSRTLLLIPAAGLGESWLAMDDSNVTASVISLEEGTVLGETDSLKTIQFSNSATWILSKNHGVVQADDLFFSTAHVHLTGIETRQLGEKLLQFEDFYNFHIGDVFEWRYEYNSIGGFLHSMTKWEILNKEVYPDSFRYYIHFKRKYVINGGGLNSTYYNNLLVWIQVRRGDYQTASSYNKQGLLLPGNFENTSTYSTSFEGGKKIGNRATYQSPQQLLCSIFPSDNFQEIYTASSQANGDCCNIDNTSCQWQRYYEEYRVGLGRVELETNVLDIRTHDRLVGAVIQGDTVWGHISPDMFFTATQSPQTAQPLLITPNPADDFIQFSTGNQEGDIQVSISDGNGKVLIRQQMNTANTAGLDISHLPRGMYFVQLVLDRRTWAGRFLKG